MITDRAKAGFDTLFQAALRGSLSRADAPCRVEPVEAIGKVKHRKMVVLTVSSYLFRLLAVVHFRDDAATRAFFAGGGGEDAGAGTPAALSDQAFIDRVCESGNLACGALNRDLGHHFPHVGMSTPHVIDRDCLRYVELLGCGLQRHYQLTLAGDVTLYASLCVSDYGTVDFHAPPAEEATETVSTGELEFF